MLATQQTYISKNMPRLDDTSVVHVLCLDDDSNLLATRVAVLRHHGYEAVGEKLAECAGVLCRRRFDLIVISHSAQQADLDAIKPFAGATLLLRLVQLTLPVDLLTAVEEKLAVSRKLGSRSA